jgi:hypothetical protein
MLHYKAAKTTEYKSGNSHSVHLHNGPLPLTSDNRLLSHGNSEDGNNSAGTFIAPKQGPPSTPIMAAH